MGPGLTAVQPSSEPVVVTIRAASSSDLQFVRGTWSRSFARHDRARKVGPKPHEIPALERAVDLGRRIDGVALDERLLVRAHHRLVDELLALPDVLVAVACLPDVPDSPVGWACWQGDVLHFVYVAPIARRSTIGRQLVLHTRARVASHSTTDGAGLVKHLRGPQ